MKKSAIALLMVFLILPGINGICAAEQGENSGVFSRDSIVSLMYRANAYAMAHPWQPDDHNWIRATWYTGVMALHRTTGDPAILRQAMDWAAKHGWREGDEYDVANRKTCGQTYLELYFLKRDPEMIAHIRAFVDGRMALNESPRKRWYYCDCLYVGPPAIAMLGRATGERKYYDYLHRVYWDVVDYLFDDEAGLFYRDSSFFDTRTALGHKVLWSRGNGWVIAGIPRVLEYLEPDDPQRSRYVVLFRRMAASIAAVQGDDGLWRTNLADPAQFPEPESSGTAFFCYAMAWGINNGILERETYLPVVQRAWRGLAAAVDSQGKLCRVQPVGDRPARVERESTHEYAVGAFLLAGSEMVKVSQGR
ncbi:MAG: glycoside hydrolase family 105 protein [Candidatus Glassbacteria bacterium]|nr:glycoside hydrolase family 105 protein [Candidatus Glassbacteria bacterium]